MSWGNLLFRFLRLGPLGLGAIAVAILGLGFYLQIGENTRSAAKAEAFAAGPPPAVDIIKFDRDRDMTDRNEVVVRAQPLIEYAYRLTYTRDNRDEYGFMVPLVATNASTDRVVAGVAFYTSDDFTFDDLSSDLFFKDMSGFGEFGPILEFNGWVHSLGQWQDMTDEAFVEQGLTMARDAVIVWPFVEGREAAFAPSDTTIFGLLSKIAGAIGLLALGKMVFRSAPAAAKKDGLSKLENGVQRAPAAPLNTYDAAPKTKAVPLWKQRSGLADPVGGDDNPPAVFDPVDFSATAQTAMAKPKRTAIQARSGWGFRKILAVIVGLLFVLTLGATVSSLMSEVASSEVVEVRSAPQMVAQQVADAVIPDADPNRHWTDIDVTPIAEWFVAQFLLAAGGDVAAQINLGMIAGGVLFALFVIRYFFAMRRALRPKTSARFDSMGLN